MTSCVIVGRNIISVICRLFHTPCISCLSFVCQTSAMVAARVTEHICGMLGLVIMYYVSMLVEYLLLFLFHVGNSFLHSPTSFNHD
jgi:hypothetical protein